MGGVKPSDFEFASLTRGKMAPVEQALEQMGNRYREILSEKMLDGAQYQQQLLEQAKVLDKNAATAATQLRGISDHSATETAAESLRLAVVESRKSLQGIIDSLHAIDTQLPQSDRLLASSGNHTQYPLLSTLLEERAVYHPSIGQTKDTAAAACIQAAVSTQISPRKSARAALEQLRR